MAEVHNDPIALKSAGNAAFRAEDWEAAAELYRLALAVSGTEQEVRISLLSSRAACNLKLGRFQFAVDNCTAVLDADPAHTKAL
jgi:Flp pilus assembly protein TadD